MQVSLAQKVLVELSPEGKGSRGGSLAGLWGSKESEWRWGEWGEVWSLEVNGPALRHLHADLDHCAPIHICHTVTENV